LGFRQFSCLNDSQARVLLGFLGFGANLRVDDLSGASSFTSLPDKHLGVGLLWCDCLPELLLVDLLIGVKVDSSDNCEVVCIRGFLSLGVEKPFEVFLVDVAQIAVVNSPEGGLLVVALARL